LLLQRLYTKRGLAFTIFLSDYFFPVLNLLSLALEIRVKINGTIGDRKREKIKLPQKPSIVFLPRIPTTNDKITYPIAISIFNHLYYR